jgi:NADH-quinone oxidoreductase subunit J
LSAQLVIFFILAAVAVGSGILVVAHRNPVRSALFLVLNLLTVAALYLTLSAQFIAAVQVIVYAGAIMVLFLFVIMLLNMGSPDSLRERGGLSVSVAALLALVFLTILTTSGSLKVGLAPSGATPESLATGGTVETIGRNLFDSSQPWVLPFEVTSVLLLIGIVGSVVLAKRRI